MKLHHERASAYDATSPDLLTGIRLDTPKYGNEAENVDSIKVVHSHFQVQHLQWCSACFCVLARR